MRDCDLRAAADDPERVSAALREAAERVLEQGAQGAPELQTHPRRSRSHARQQYDHLVISSRTSSSRARCFCPVVQLALVRVRVRADELRKKTEAFLHERSSWMYVILICILRLGASLSLFASRSTVL